MPQRRVKSLTVRGLWGYRNVSLRFFSDVNILIGRNGSGKTTIMNLLWSAMSGDFVSLASADYESLELKLTSWDEQDTTFAIVVAPDGLGGMNITVEGKKFEVPGPSDDWRAHPSRVYRYQQMEQFEAARAALGDATKAVWLPVSRRLPIPEEEEDALARRSRGASQRLESVDHTIRRLLRELRDYRALINVQLSQRFKEFEREVLTLMLYDKKEKAWAIKHDELGTDDQEKLLKAFSDVGILNPRLQSRVQEHFEAAKKVMDALRKGRNLVDLDADIMMVFPLIRRTSLMIEQARKLEEDRIKLLAAQALFISTTNRFLKPKTISISDDGILSVHDPRRKKDIEPSLLSSGEKQIMILLIQALLNEREPVIYLADEPELSLHVSWQDQLVNAIMKLGGQMQLIVATHSPDVIGEFQANVLNLDRQE